MDLLDHLLKVNNIFTNFFFGKKKKLPRSLFAANYWRDKLLNQHRSILNLDLESTERDPISLGVSYFYLKF